MVAQTEEKPESKDQFTYYREEIDRLQAENKGLITQNRRLKRKSTGSDSKSAQNTDEIARNNSEQGEQSSKQLGEIHLAHPWERTCSTCGGANEGYKGPANVFCTDPECVASLHGNHYPMGHVEPGEIKKLDDGRVDMPTVKACLNCGKDDSAEVVS